MPMTKEHTQEALSNRFVTAIANYCGYATSRPEFDYGTDIEIHEVSTRKAITSGNRYAFTNRRLQLQLKSVQKHRIEERSGKIIYDLQSETWNDLIELRDTYNPLILVLFVLPDDEKEWITLKSDSLIMRKCAYWFIPDPTDVPTTNIGTKRISIPTTQILEIGTLPLLFDQFNP